MICRDTNNETKKLRETNHTNTNYSSIAHNDLIPESNTQYTQENSENTSKENKKPFSLFKINYFNISLDKYSTSIYLENKGSVARDHLANERTYLAWLRTSLSTISVGIGLTQLFRLERSMRQNPDEHPNMINGQMIGILFILISVLLLIFAFIRYFHAQVAMVNGYFPASRSTVLIAASSILFTMTLILFLILNQ